MISVIVSSCDKANLSNLTRSIEETIDAVHEIVVIENDGARYGLTEAYNQGASRSKYPFLLFVHEDVIFETYGWGKILINYLATLDNVGIVGVAGTEYKPFVPSGWAFNLTRPLSYSLLQGSKYQNLSTVSTKANCSAVRKMICLDGVFLALRRDVFETVRFDETLEGFHGYDTDFSLRVSEKYQNYFVPDILIEHFSEGKISDQWLINAYRISEKWKAKLPRSVAEKGIDLECELSAYNMYVNLLYESSLSGREKARYLVKTTVYALMKSRSPRFIKALFYSIRERRFNKRS